jgi:hypothetical protein
MEIREVLLQVAVYCGIPAAADAFRTAHEALAEWQDSTEGVSTVSSDQIDRATVESLAKQAQLPLDAKEANEHIDRLKDFSEWMDDWANEPLPFRFAEGEFSYTPLLAQLKPDWTTSEETSEADQESEGNAER